MYGCCYPVCNECPCFMDQCGNVLPLNCNPCIPCSTFPRISKKTKVPDFEQELELKRILALKDREKEMSKSLKGKRKKNCKCGPTCLLPNSSKKSTCNCTKEKLLPQETKRMAPINEEDEEGKSDEVANTLQDTITNFLTIVNESVCETVQKCIESMLTDFFDQTLERLNSLCTQTVRNECLISKLYLDAMDRFTQMEERNCEQMKAMCAAITQSVLASQQPACRARRSVSKDCKPDFMEDCMASIRRASMKQTKRCSQKESHKTRSSRQSDSASARRNLSETSDNLNNLSSLECTRDTCPYILQNQNRAQNSNNSSCCCAETSNRDRSARQNELLQKYRKLSNFQNN